MVGARPIGSLHAPRRCPATRSASLPRSPAAPLPEFHEVPLAGRWRRVGVLRPAVVVAGHSGLLDRLPVVRRPRPRERVRLGVRRPGRPGGVVHGALLRDPVRQPHDGRSLGAANQTAGAGGGPAARLPPDGGPSEAAGPTGAFRPVRADLGARRVGALAGVAAVHQCRGLRHPRCPVRSRSRLLRLPPTVHEFRGRLVVRHADHHPRPHHDPPLHQRWHPAPDDRRAGPATGQGPPVGAAGPHRPGAGR